MLVEELLLGGEGGLGLAVLAPEAAGELVLELVAGVGDFTQQLLARARRDHVAELLDADAFVGEGLLAALDVFLGGVDLDFLLGHEADVGLHLGEDVVEKVAGAGSSNSMGMLSLTAIRTDLAELRT